MPQMGKQWRYGIVLDAGSSGTRIHVYRWEDATKARQHASTTELRSLPRITLENTEKTKPGVSSFANNPHDIGRDHLQPLVEAALHVIPRDAIGNTPIFLMATAGMRLLPDDQQSAILDGICTFFKSETDFLVPDCESHVRVISGTTEGLYGWIAANYLLGGFDHPEENAHGKGHHTIGFLDMGGASAQIAFAPNATEAEKHWDDLKLVRLRTMDGMQTEYKVFVMSWLGFGANQARESYVRNLVELFGSEAGLVNDPCLPRGLLTTISGEAVDEDDVTSEELLLLGTGDFPSCIEKAHPLLGKDVPCENDPCLLNGTHVPLIDFDVNHFIGISEFWHTTHGVFGGKSKAYDLDTYEKRVMDFCSRRWDDIEADIVPRKKTEAQKEKDAQEACFKAAWLLSVLYDGIGIPRVGLDETSPVGWNVSKPTMEKAKDSGLVEPFRPVNKVDGVEISWTLGKMVLYASGEVPPQSSAGPVGFGSNDGDLPSDFEYPGSTWRLPGMVTGDEEDDSDGSSRSTSSLVAFVLVLLLIGFWFRKRERRLRAGGWLGGFFRRRYHGGSSRKLGQGLLGRLLGTGWTSYERIMEEGEAENFELGATDADDWDFSDSSDGSRGASGSGPWVGEERKRFGDRTPDDLGISRLSQMDRSGLAVRTESRDRLSVKVQMLTAGKRSRATSPNRQKSPLTSPFHVD